MNKHQPFFLLILSSYIILGAALVTVSVNWYSDYRRAEHYLDNWIDIERKLEESELKYNDLVYKKNCGAIQIPAAEMIDKDRIREKSL